MKKMKKLLAILMTMAMVMGLGITGFAATNETGTITVSGLASTGTNTVTYYKILKPDVTVSNSGYAFADGVTMDGYANAKAFINAQPEDKMEALNDAKEQDTLGTGITGAVSNNTFSAEVEAGYYAVFVTNTPGADDPAIEYTTPMIVSVGYNKATLQADGTYQYDAVETEDSKVVAKYETIPIEKTSDESDGVVGFGDTVEYTINTMIPSETQKFSLTDTLKGATYNKESVSIEIDGYVGDIEENNLVKFDDNSNTMTIDLTSFIEQYAGKKVTITYEATVTGKIVNNKVVSDDPNHKYNEDKNEVELYTGAMKFTKTGENADATGLNDAKFKIYREDGKYLKETKDDADNTIYAWVDVNEASVFTTKTVGEEKGIIYIEGLDLGKYYFEEIEAPNGYSINTEDTEIEIKNNNITAEGVATVSNPAIGSMIDTKLPALPSTGGMGTTLFTIAGCVIMISAAGLFFATRKKAN